MTIHLDSGAIRHLCSEQVAFAAAKLALEEQREGRYQLPARIDVDVPTGFLRMMPAALGDYMGGKIMTLAKGVGNRYLLLVYAQESGELVATLDAAEITRLRTAAFTALAGQLLCPDGADVLGLIGTGFEAESHLRALARLWPLTKVQVFSRSGANRQTFAGRMSDELGIDVVPATAAAEVTGASPVTVLCTKATAPVVTGDSFTSGAVVLSIGATRLDLRELDDATLSRARQVLVDDSAQVLTESGDVASAVAAGAIDAGRLVQMEDWPVDECDTDDGRDLLVFKSVGTALQDLALAAILIDSANEQSLGREIGEITELKSAARENGTERTR